jgi:hypothetical protein
MLKHSNPDNSVKAVIRERQIVSIAYDIRVDSDKDVGVDDVHVRLALQYAAIAGTHNEHTLALSSLSQQRDEVGAPTTVASVIICQVRQMRIDEAQDRM